MQESFIPGSSLQALDGEEVRKRYSALFLTNRRLISSARNLVQVAFLRDTDYAGFITRGLPLWMLILGIVLGVTGLGILSTDSNDFNSNENETFGYLLLFTGGGLILAWFFIKNTYLVFAVSGTDKFEVKVTSVGGTSAEATEFINEVMRTKAELDAV